MAAALMLANRGLEVAVFDEQPRLGGQILRQPPVSFRIEHWLPGRAYRESKKLLKEAEANSAVTWLSGTTAWGVFQKDIKTESATRSFEIRYTRGPLGARLRAQRVLIAAGCYEMPVPLPGWTLPGVMATGGIQALFKSQQVIAGTRIVLAGSHPLQLVVAEQLVAIGANVEAVLFAQPWRRVFRFVFHPWLFAREWRRLGDVARILWRLRARRIPVRFARTVTRAEGAERLESVQIAHVGPDETLGPATERISCDVLGLCFGFLPSSELARQAGAQSHWVESGGWAIDSDGVGRSSVPGLYVAGEVTGIKGADAARLEGEIAALSLLRDAGIKSVTEVTMEQRPKRRRLQALESFAEVLAETSSMGDAFFASLPSRDTLICRCEEISCADLERTLQDNPHLGTVSATKLLTRVGMGLCQGRYCEGSVRRVLRRRGRDAGHIGGNTIRPPVKPVLIRALCSEPGVEKIDPDKLENLEKSAHIRNPEISP